MSSGWNTVETPMFLNGFRSIIRIGSTLSHLHSDAAFSCYLYFHSAWRWLLSYSKILHCLLHSENYWYVQFHSVWWWLLSCRKILHCLLHSDAFYWYVYFHSVWWWLVSYIETPSTAICTSSKPDGDCCSTFRHILLLFVLPLSLMVIVVLHSDTFYCYLYFH